MTQQRRTPSNSRSLPAPAPSRATRQAPATAPRPSRAATLARLRHSLVASVLALGLCLSMFVGSTYAWFSDKATTAPETLTAGNLQVELQKWNGTDYVPVSESNPVFDPDFRWEPGRFVYIPLAVKNVGSLSALCNVILTVQNLGLADILDYVVIPNLKGENVANDTTWGNLVALSEVNGVKKVSEPGDAEISLDVSNSEYTDLSLAGVQATVLLGAKNDEGYPLNIPAGAIEYFVLGVHMGQDDEGVHMLKSIKMDLMVNAVQNPSESDNFGSNYDEGLTLPEPHHYVVWGEIGSLDSPEGFSKLVKTVTGQDVPTSEITKVVFGRWSDYESELGKLWKDGVSLGTNGFSSDGEQIEDSETIKGFYTEDKGLYILVNDPMGFIYITGTMSDGHNGYFTGWTSLKEVDFSCANTYKLGSKSLEETVDPAVDSASMACLFSGCTNLQSITFGSGFDTSKVTDMHKMFDGCEKLETLDLSTFNTSSVENMAAMFHGCSSLISLDLSTFDTRNVARVSYYLNEGRYEGMFEDCTNLTNIITTPSIFTFEKVDTEDEAARVGFANLFKGCDAVVDVQPLLSGLNTASVTSLSGMFENCAALTSVDLATFDTSNVTDMSNMFSGCARLTSVNLTSFKTWDGGEDTGVKTFENMFLNCTSLTDLDLSSFDTRRDADITMMFSGCKNLETIWATQASETHTGFSVTTTVYNDVVKDCISLNKTFGDDSEEKVFDPNPTLNKVQLMKYNASYTSSTYVIVGSSLPYGEFSYVFGGYLRNASLKPAA